MPTAIALVVCVGVSAAGQLEAGAEPRFVAECILVRAGLEELDLLLHPSRAQRAANGLLREHAYEHGWSWNFGVPDWITPEQGAACPEDLLDHFERAGAAPGAESTFLITVAEVLARNGRVEEALELLRRSAGAVLPGKSQPLSPWVYAEMATRIAAHVGQWERGLELSADWGSTSTCGNCRSSEEGRILAWRARCWAELGYCDLVREEGLKSFARHGNPELIELWIECQIREGQAPSASQALESILMQAPEEAGSICRDAHRRWELVHMPESELGEHLSELAAAAQERAILFIRTLDPALVIDRLSAFDRVGEDMRDPSLAWAFVYSGRPEVDAIFHTSPEIEALLQRSISDRPEDRFGLLLWEMHVAWQDANERWRCLTSRR